MENTENGVMNKFLELFGASSHWGQSSNSNFTEYIINENKHLKAELLSLRKEADKRHGDLKDEVAQLLERNRVLKEKLRLRMRPDVNSRSVSPYIPAPIAVPTFTEGMRCDASTVGDSALNRPDVNSRRVPAPIAVPTFTEGMRCDASTVDDSALNRPDVNSRRVPPYIPAPIAVPTFTEGMRCDASTVDGSVLNRSDVRSRSVPSYISAPIAVPTFTEGMRCDTSTVDGSALNKRTKKSVSGSKYIPTPIKHLRHNTSTTTSHVSCDNIGDVNVSRAVNATVDNASTPINVTTATNGSRTVKDSTHVNGTVPTKVTTAANGSRTVKNSTHVNGTVAAKVTTAANGSRTTSFTSTVNDVTSDNITEDYTQGFYPSFIATPLSNGIDELAFRKRPNNKLTRTRSTPKIKLPYSRPDTSKFKLPYSTPNTETATVYTPSFYDPMVVSISSDDERM